MRYLRDLWRWLRPQPVPVHVPSPPAIVRHDDPEGFWTVMRTWR